MPWTLAGPAARWRSVPGRCGLQVAVAHWDYAVAQGVRAGRLPAEDKPERSYAALSAFWSGQAGVMIESVGLSEGADAMMIAPGDPATDRFRALYGREGRCLAAVSVECGRWPPADAERIAAAAPFPPGEAVIDWAGSRALLAPGFS
ncbi:hypothetical protein MKK88_05125 [Methylobacterium sp. E-005]|uniref:oxidoreductase C-terminal domain-containing protein n=1 Tax=Methylobacterium sp. E-005 TaxID=2836549 RepID=UPI001FBA0B50|nr:oxidoreductase C-terminal domain-containing protein [Methylobacterium sp. E-005]MCJ2085375.1 hypothetical protein [Methylobacterium sp. E-005]